MNACIITTALYPNATASYIRQETTAKLLMCNGYSVTIIGLSSSCSSQISFVASGITYVLFPRNFVNFSNNILNYFKSLDYYFDVLFLNGAPVISFKNITYYATTLNIALLYDCVEYPSMCECIMGHFISLRSFIWYLQMTLRNRFLINENFNLVVTSTYLYYYFQQKGFKPYRLPMTMDSKIFKHKNYNSNNMLSIVYAGSPGRKDYLSEIIFAIKQMSLSEQELLDVTLFGVDNVSLSKLTKLSLSELNGMSWLHVCGKISHEDVLQKLLSTDFTILIRSSTARYAKAGFPTKVVESLMSSTPVICNMTSDLGMYLKDGYNCIEVTNESSEQIVIALRRALALTPDEKNQMKINSRKTAEKYFDYRRYVGSFGEFIKNCV